MTSLTVMSGICWLQCYAVTPAKLCLRLAKATLQSYPGTHSDEFRQSAKAEFSVAQKPDSQEVRKTIFIAQNTRRNAEHGPNPSKLYSQQEAHRMPLARTVLLLAAVVTASVAVAQTPPPASQQTATAPMPVYDVISVKRDKPAESAQAWSASLQPDGYSAKGINLMFLLIYAYKIAPNYRIIGAPAWWDENRYDIQAKVGDSDLPAFQRLPYPQREAMLQQVLTERFKLKVHLEVRTQPIYSLVVAQQGVLTEAPPPPDGKPVGMGIRPGRGDRVGQMMMTDFTTAFLAAQFSGLLGRMVVDNTGLTGQYHADLHWTPDRVANVATDPTADVQELSIFTALQEQLGLKLVPTKGPVECLIIDHVELPSEN